MSYYDELKKRSDKLNGKRFRATLFPSLLTVIAAAFFAWKNYSHAIVLFLSLLGCFLVPFLFHFFWKAILPNYRSLLGDIEKVNLEISKLSKSVQLIYEKYPSRQRGQQFKKACDLTGLGVEEFEKTLAVGMKREKKEVFVTAFVRNQKVVRVTASIGSDFSCRNADDLNLWKQHMERLGCDAIRQYHNHPEYNNSAKPSPGDIRTAKIIKSYLDGYSSKLRSFIIYWNQIDEWRILEYDEEGKCQLAYEFDVTKNH